MYHIVLGILSHWFSGLKQALRCQGAKRGAFGPLGFPMSHQPLLHLFQSQACLCPAKLSSTPLPPSPQISVSLTSRSKFYWKTDRQSLQGNPHSKLLLWDCFVLFFSHSSSINDTEHTTEKKLTSIKWSCIFTDEMCVLGHFLSILKGIYMAIGIWWWIQ